MKNPTNLQGNTILAVILIIVLFMGSTVWTRFDSVKLTSNPALYFGNAQDTVSNRTAGTLEFGSIIKAKSFIGDTNLVPGNVWQVAPAFTLNTYRKTSPTIQAAIDAIDSGVISIAPGVYTERITLKSRITLLGSGERTHIVRSDDTAAVYGINLSNVTIKNLRITATQTNTDTVNAVKIRRSYTDTTSTPTIVFENVKIEALFTSGTGVAIYGITADSASFIFRDSYIRVVGEASVGSDRACFNVAKGSVYGLYRNTLVCSSGESVDVIVWARDTRTKLTAGYNQYMCTLGAVFAQTPGTAPYARYYHNTGNVAMTDNLTNLITTPYNVSDVNFYIK